MTGFHFKYTVLVLLTIFITSCGVIFDSGDPVADTQQPSVARYTPSDNSPLVDHEIAVSVEFNETIKRGSVNSNTLSLRASNNTLVSSIYEFTDNDRDVRIVPSAPLDGDTSYIVSVTTGIVDLAGNHLSADVSWSFTTAPTGIGNWVDTSLSGAIEVDYSLFLKSVWSGSEMLTWSGSAGYRYNPATDSLTAMSLINAPSHRFGHTAVWTGTEMIIWGGGGDYLNDGARYNPATDTWQSVTTSGAPEGRNSHSAVWTGTQMLIWGGRNGSLFPEYPEKGGIYTPATDTWVAMSTGNVPSGRNLHTAVWTGQEMVVWGGVNSIFSDTYYLSSGGRYDPSTDTWISTTSTDAPVARAAHTAIWNESEMIVWGGNVGNWQYLTSGAKYNPVADEWLPTAPAEGLLPRYGHSAVWTGNAMIIWGGSTRVFDTQNPRTGGLYYPPNDIWLYTTTANAPIGRTGHAAVWAGSEMVIWGGNTGSGLPLENGGGVYIP